MCFVYFTDRSDVVSNFVCSNINDIVMPINVEKLRFYLWKSKFNWEKTKVLLKGFTYGFDIGYRGPMERTDKSENIPISVGSKKEMWEKLMKEVKVNHYAGPFHNIPYRYYIQSPIGLVPKDKGKQTRLIFHLSYDFGKEDHQKSLNFHTPEEICTVKYNDMDHAIGVSLNLLRRHAGSEQKLSLFYSKSDLRSAFHLLPILPVQRFLLIMKCEHPITCEVAYFVEKCLPFGASISCARFQLFSDCLKHIFEYVFGDDSCTNYLDDFLFISVTEERCNEMVRVFLELCGEIGCPVALDKTEYVALKMTFLGLLMDGESLTISVPDEKRKKALDLLHYALDKKKVTIKFIQRITGTLNFLCRAIVPGRAFTRGMHGKLKLTDAAGVRLKHYHHVNLGKCFLDNCRMWLYFMDHTDSETLCCPFVDAEMYVLAKKLHFFTDSSLNPELDCGGVFGKRWFVQHWDADFILEQKSSIEYLELYTLLAGLLIWGKDPRLCNTSFTIYCDNESVKSMVNQLSTNCMKCVKLIRVLAYDSMIHNRKVVVHHVRSKLNIQANALSRFQFQRFWDHSPKDMLKLPDKIPHTIWPMQRIWFSPED